MHAGHSTRARSTRPRRGMLAARRPSPPTPQFGRLGTAACDRTSSRPTWLVTGGSGFLGHHPARTPRSQSRSKSSRLPVAARCTGASLRGRWTCSTASVACDGPSPTRAVTDRHLSPRRPDTAGRRRDRRIGSNRVATLRLIEAVAAGLEMNPHVWSWPDFSGRAGPGAGRGFAGRRATYPARPKPNIVAPSKLASDARRPGGPGGIVARVFKPDRAGHSTAEPGGRTVCAAILAEREGPITLNVGDAAPRLRLHRRARRGVRPRGTRSGGKAGALPRRDGRVAERRRGAGPADPALWARPVRVNVDRSRSPRSGRLTGRHRPDSPRGRMVPAHPVRAERGGPLAGRRPDAGRD